MDWTYLLNVFVLVLVCVGHVLLVRASLNWCFKWAIPQPWWHLTSGSHVAAAVVGPVLLVMKVGRHGAKVLRGGSWAAAGAGWKLYALVCLTALVVVAVKRARARRHRQPAALLAEHARAVDVVGGSGGDRPAGTGVKAWLVHLPGNEVFDFHVMEREIALPNLPPAWDGLTVLHVTDLHYNGTPGRAFFERALAAADALEPDLVALTGDILDHHALADWLPSTLGQLRAPLGRYFVLGNHDTYDDPERIRAAVRDLGWTDVGGRSVVHHHAGHALLVAGTAWPWLRDRPALPEPADESDAPPPGLRLLLSHSPDQFAWAQARGYDLVLAGHLHGGQIRLPLLGPLLGGRYAEGVFAAGPTVMHVCRGLGVNFPLRWRCPPQVSKLVLRRGIQRGMVTGSQGETRPRNTAAL